MTTLLCTTLKLLLLYVLIVAGKMAVLEVGNCHAEQLQLLLQHPAVTGAFAVYVCRNAALSASLAASGVAEAAANVHIEKATAQLKEIASSGLYQVIAAWANMLACSLQNFVYVIACRIAAIRGFSYCVRNSTQLRSLLEVDWLVGQAV